MRLARQGSGETRVDKASRAVKPGDTLTFAIDGRLFSVTVQGLGARRGPASEARGLYCDAAH